MGHSFRYIFSRSLNCAWLKCSIAKYIEEGHDNKNLKEVLPPTFVIIRNKYILMYNTICLHIRPTFEHENVAIQTSSNTKTIFTGKVIPVIKVIRYDIFFLLKWLLLHGTCILCRRMCENWRFCFVSLNWHQFCYERHAFLGEIKDQLAQMLLAP